VLAQESGPIGQKAMDELAAGMKSKDKTIAAMAESAMKTLITNLHPELAGSAGLAAGAQFAAMFGVGAGVSMTAGAAGAWILNNSSLGPHKAAGGPVTAGMPYIVGEHRPELFVPATNGTILPSVPTALAAGSSSSTITTGDIIIQAGSLAGSDAEAREFARSIFGHLEDEAQRRGRVLAPVR
jgi:hypothetical protein